MSRCARPSTPGAARSRTAPSRQPTTPSASSGAGRRSARRSRAPAARRPRAAPGAPAESPAARATTGAWAARGRRRRGGGGRPLAALGDERRGERVEALPPLAVADTDAVDHDLVHAREVAEAGPHVGGAGAQL